MMAPHTVLNIALYSGLHLAIIFYRYEGRHTDIILALHGDAT
jgi:hypothetical protein